MIHDGRRGVGANTGRLGLGRSPKSPQTAMETRDSPSGIPTTWTMSRCPSVTATQNKAIGGAALLVIIPQGGWTQ
jgi:hypothetical protein